MRTLISEHSLTAMFCFTRFTTILNNLMKQVNKGSRNAHHSSKSHVWKTGIMSVWFSIAYQVRAMKGSMPFGSVMISFLGFVDNYFESNQIFVLNTGLL